MPTIVTIPSPDEPFSARRFRVFTSQNPTTDDGDWIERPYLHVDRLTRAAAPAIDECRLSYLVGDFSTREADNFGNDPASGIYSPLSVSRHYIKVQLIEDTTDDPETPEDESTEPTVLLTWYGRIEGAEERAARDPDVPTTQTGVQLLFAFGLLRELELEPVLTAQVQDAGGNLQEIGRGLPFNKYFGDAFPERGNRTEFEVNHGDGESDYIFSWAPTQNVGGDSGTRAEKWSASQAVAYMLKFNKPVNDSDEAKIEWEIEGDISAALDWYDITTDTDRRSVKRVLDELIDRRRLAGYWVDVDDSGETLTAKLNVFTFADQEISISQTGDSIAANANPIELICESSKLVREQQIRTMATHRCDTLRVEGAPITTTFTIPYGTDLLEDGWTLADESTYNAAESDITRLMDELRDVFSRFIVSDDWNLQVTDDSDENAPVDYFVVIDPEDLPDDLSDDEVSDLFRSDGDSTVGKLWFRGSRFLPWLELKLDDSSNEYRRPFVLFEEPNVEDTWRYAEAVSEGDDQRPFNCHTGMLTETLGIRVTVNRPAGAHLIASGAFTGSVENDALDPEKAAALDYAGGKMQLTATLEWDERVAVEKVLTARDDGNRVLRVIPIDDARLAFLLPGTTTDIDDEGQRDRSASGKVLRDDRDRLRNILEAAGAWYGTDRRPMLIAFGSLEQTVQIGQLVTKLVIGNNEEEINTPITGITHSVSERGVMTRIETSYADADFRL